MSAQEHRRSRPIDEQIIDEVFDAYLVGGPLYRYRGDTKSGDANGQGLTAFGGAWFALSAAGDLRSCPATKSGGGGIY